MTRIRLSIFMMFTIALVAVLPASMVSIVMYRQAYDVLAQQTYQRMGFANTELASELKHQFERANRDLVSFSQLSRVREGVGDLLYSNLLQQDLKELLSKDSVINGIYLADRQGEILLAAGGDMRALMDQHVFAQSSFSSLMNPGNINTNQGRMLLLSNERLSGLSEAPNLMLVAHPIFSRSDMDNQELRGYLLATIPLQTLLRVSSSVQNERVLYRAILVGGKWMAGDYFDDKREDLFASVGSVVLNDSHLAGAQRFSLVVADNADIVADEVATVLQPVITMSMVSVLVVLIFAAIVATWISRMMGRLYATIQSFRDSNLTPASNTFFIREFDEVQVLLSDMRATIHDQMHEMKAKTQTLEQADRQRHQHLKEIETLNMALEAKVEARTAELEASIAIIERNNSVLESLLSYRRALALLTATEEMARLTLQQFDQLTDALPCALYLPTIADQSSVFLADASIVRAEAAEQIARISKDGWLQGLATTDNGHLAFKIGIGDNQFGWLLIVKSRIESADVRWIPLFLRELSSHLTLFALNRELLAMARTDALTQLGNRKAFDECMEELETHLDAEVGLFILDVNGLKLVNDQKGHDVGDQLIIRVAQYIDECTSDITGHRFRLGGDEFAIVLVNDQLKQSNVLFRRLSEKQKHVEFAFDVLGNCQDFSFSIGFASTENTAFSMLYRVADQSMYRTKQEHYRNQ